MIVTKDFRLALDEAPTDDLLPARLDRPGLRRRLAAVLEDLEEVAEPAACYAGFPIERVLHERLELADGTRIGCGPLASVVGNADELYVAVCTLGRALDERIRAYRGEGRSLEMLLLDELGSWAIDRVRTQLYERVQGELAERGRHLSSPLSPGESEWPMREQRIVFGLLDTRQIGVTLGASDLMRPIKSVSLVFGAGAEQLGTAGLSRCHYCSIRDRCRYAA